MGMNVFVPQVNAVRGEARPSLPQLIDQVNAGYPFASFERLAQDLDLTQRELADVLGLSGGTLARRRGQRLSPTESSRVYEVRRLLEQAEQAIGHPEDARRWLRESNPNLGTSPLSLARTAPGLEAVERYLQQIAEGVVL